ncbi:hypothetical protein NEISUBOT_05352 [Neisseria subflava NJ9703]|uniref:Uncharacterized protein n=1 Tax=Neisseria subflava NJ9703 TaxID=546268 RepID=A0A9W5IP95_NEISU|nr:hypothetical protein NEISUBOT_05352 [Neisseria subflava NJ9703]
MVPAVRPCLTAGYKITHNPTKLHKRHIKAVHTAQTEKQYLIV